MAEVKVIPIVNTAEVTTSAVETVQSGLMGSLPYEEEVLQSTALTAIPTAKRDVMIKQGDTRNAIYGVLKNNGVPVNLTRCSVMFAMNNGIYSYAEVVDASSGTCFYTLNEFGVSETGIFKAEFRVIYEDGRTETFPNNGYITVNITKSIGGEYK